MATYYSSKRARRNKKPDSFLSSFYQVVIIVVIAFSIRTFIYGLYQVPTGSMETTMLVGERFLADKLTIWFNPPKRGDIITLNAPTYPYASNPLVNIYQRYIWGPSNWTKRVIGIPGDHVKGVIENGHPVVYVNDNKLNEPYLNKYPLISVWRDCPPLKYAHGGQLRDGTFDNRSYDLDMLGSKQPFYLLDPVCIVKQNGRPILKYPGTADSHDEFDVRLGENEYWVMGDNRRGSWDSRGWGKLDGRLIHGKIIFRIWSHDSRHDWWIVDLIKHPLEFWSRMRWSRSMQKVH